MKAYYTLNLVVGLLAIILSLVLGEAGYVAIAVAAFGIFLRKRKLDEREYQLFYKAGDYTLVGIILSMVAVYMLRDYKINNIKIDEVWFQLFIGSFYFFNGLTGLMMFGKTEE